MLVFHDAVFRHGRQIVCDRSFAAAIILANLWATPYRQFFL
jgi:hypothetical protein